MKWSLLWKYCLMSCYITINHTNILPTGLHITITDMMIIAHGYILTNYYWIVVEKILTNICQIFLKYPNSWHPTMAKKLLTLSHKNLCKDSNAVVYHLPTAYSRTSLNSVAHCAPPKLQIESVAGVLCVLCDYLEGTKSRVFSMV